MVRLRTHIVVYLVQALEVWGGCIAEPKGNVTLCNSKVFLAVLLTGHDAVTTADVSPADRQ